MPGAVISLDEGERRALLDLARTAIEARLTGRPVPSVPALGLETPVPSGVFVTLRLHDRLRGCIGAIDTTDPLPELVTRVAADAATEDPRFPPLPADALAEVQLEISVLGPLEPVRDPAGIEVGRHGLVVEQGERRGLLLPQVRTEWGWDRDTFLAQTCRKAGLASDAWQRGAILYRFEALVFAEAAR